MSSTAANRVFAIPELLENILIHTRDDWHTRMLNETRPEKSLFRLLRVSRTFQATIEGAAELQRFIFIAPLGSTATTTGIHEHAEFGPVDWLTELLAHYHDSEYTEEPSQLDYFLYPVSTTTYSDEDDEYLENFKGMWHNLQRFRRIHNGHHEASWRRMRLLLLPDCELTIKFTVCLGNNDQAETMKVRWKFGANQKLGDFFDKWERLLEAIKPQAE